MHLVDVEYLDGWDFPADDTVLWEVEVGARVLPGGGLRWSSIARLPGLTSDDAALISPWESAVHPEPYQLVPQEAGIRGEGHERQAARYLEELERGERDAERVAPRLLDVLAGALGVPRAELGAPAGAGAALYRSGEGVPEGTGARLEALADALVTPPADGPEACRDPVDELFFG